jgi:hypothetical protein
MTFKAVKMKNQKTSVFLLFLMLIGLASAIVLICHYATQSPPNIVWALSSGYYRYDPRQQAPPNGLFLDRPEASLAYFLNSTLKACHGTYPPLSKSRIERYEVEEVEYLGHTDYHAFSLVHTRIFYANGRSARVVFRFEAGHNEGYFLISEKYPLLLTDASVVNAGAWISLSGLLRDPDVVPPGWSRYVLDGRPFVCNPGPPDKIEEQ